MTRAPTEMEACVNLAIRTAFFDHIGQVWPADVGIDLARAAIRAMREPTPEMIGAEFVYKNCHMCGGASEQYPRMIDAASPGDE